MKLVMRFNAKAQRGRLGEVVNMLKAMAANNPQLNARIYSPYIGDNDTVTWDIELADPGHLPPLMEQLMAQEFAKSLDNNTWFEAVAAVDTEVLRVEL